MRPSLDSPLHCPHFGRCGGCTRLDQPIAVQLALKQAQARTLLEPFLRGTGVDVATTLPPHPPRHDRTSILYPVQLRERRAVLGIYRTGTHDVEEIGDCRLQHRALTELGQRAGEVVRRLHLPVWNETTHKGLVRAFRARVMPGSNELLAGFVVARPEFSERAALGKALWEAASDLKDDQGRALQLVGTVLNVNAEPGNVLLGPTTLVQRGQGHQTDTVAGLRLRVSFASFYQLHRHAEAVLFRPALAMLGDVAGQRVVDGYGGVGTFALRLLRAGAAHATLVESSPSACDDARTNLRENGFADRGEVHQAAFGTAPLPPCDLLVVDPPRAGLLEPGARAVLAAAPPRVLLVSCSLESLARDLAALTAVYRVAAVRLCDLFPHTEHVEAVTLLVRRA